MEQESARCIQCPSVHIRTSRKTDFSAHHEPPVFRTPALLHVLILERRCSGGIRLSSLRVSLPTTGILVVLTGARDRLLYREDLLDFHATEFTCNAMLARSKDTSTGTSSNRKVDAKRLHRAIAGCAMNYPTRACSSILRTLTQDR